MVKATVVACARVYWS